MRAQVDHGAHDTAGHAGAGKKIDPPRARRRAAGSKALGHFVAACSLLGFLRDLAGHGHQTKDLSGRNGTFQVRHREAARTPGSSAAPKDSPSSRAKAPAGGNLQAKKLPREFPI